MQKPCETCGVMMVRKRWANGKLDSTFKNRRYCSSKCYGKANELENPTKATIRKRAQRAHKKTSCQKCGSSKRVERHHPDYKHPTIVEMLCNLCHSQLHLQQRRKAIKTEPLDLELSETQSYRR